MSLKTRIAERLRAKFTGVSLSKKSVEAIGDQFIQAGLTDESTDEEIDAKLDARNALYSFADQKKYDDYLAGKAAKEAKDKSDAEAARLKSLEDGKNPEVKTDDDTPSWAKQIIQQNQALQAEIAAIKGEKVANTRKEQYSKIVKDAPEHIKNTLLKQFDKMKFDTDEDFNAFLAESESDVAGLVQGENNSNAGGYSPTPGQPRDFGKQTASKEEVEAIVDGIV